MADMERLTDSLILHMAETEEESAYRKGLIKGKSIARIEVAIIASVAIIIYFSFN